MTKQPRNRAQPHEVVVHLSPDELETLRKLAHYYQRSMGPMRHIVRLTAPAEVRAKYRFISEESRWLQKFVESMPADLTRQTGEISAEFAARAVIAYWGRVLSSLRSKRARRRMKPEEVAIREGLSEKLGAAARELEARWPHSLESDLATRRPDEASWMREQLGGTATPTATPRSARTPGSRSQGG